MLCCGQLYVVFSANSDSGPLGKSTIIDISEFSELSKYSLEHRLEQANINIL